MIKDFWANTKPQGDCIIWTAHLDRYGYGRYGKIGAHRHAYTDKVGPIPEGLEIDHLCRVRACVNPKHLEAVTHKENTLRGLTIAARNKVATHCPRGHEYTEANTYISPKGSRHCRKCNVIAVGIYQKNNPKERKL